MRGELTRVIGANAQIASLINRLKVAAFDRSEGRVSLWINIRSWACSVMVVNAMFLTADSVAASEVSTDLRPLALVADWARDVQDWAVTVMSWAGDLIGHSYGQAPALMLGLSLIVMVPLFVAVGAILRRSGPVTEPGQTIRYPGASKLPTVHPPAHSHRLPVVGDASILIQNAGPPDTAEHRFNGALMVRIGREEDNDVCLPDPTVHRYHAVISRSADVGFVISDLSSSDGNGVVVNSERVRRQRLNDGDVITLGTSKLTFRLR